jgi:hypothetical protein
MQGFCRSADRIKDKMELIAPWDFHCDKKESLSAKMEAFLWVRKIDDGLLVYNLKGAADV